MPKAPAELDVVLYSSLMPDQLRWLWPGRIPLGKLTVISGAPGLGKSLLALDIAARVTRGGDWPDLPQPDAIATHCAALTPPPSATPPSRQLALSEDLQQTLQMLEAMQPLAKQLQPAIRTLPAVAPAGSVLLLNAEDHLADSVTPSLAAAGANFHGIVGVKGMFSRDRHYKAPPEGIDLLKHLPLLRKQLQATPHVRLMVIDPLIAYWGKVGQHPTKATYRIASALSELAAEFEMAVLVITDDRHTGLPSRTTWTIRRNWGDDDVYSWSPTQFHYGTPPTALQYRLQGNRIIWQCDPQGLPRNPDGSLQKLSTLDWLSKLLADGPCNAKVIYTTGKGLGHSKTQIFRAKQELCITTKKITQDGQSKWTWELPKGR